MASRIEEMLSGDDSAGMNFAGMTFAGVDADGEPMWKAAGMDFAGMDFAGQQNRRGGMSFAQMKQQATMQAAANAAARATPLVFNTQPKNKRIYQFGFDSGATLIAPGASATLTVQPQMIMKIRKLSTPNTDFLLNDFKIGVKSQFAAIGPCASESFNQNALGNDVDYDVVDNGYSVTVVAQNIGVAGARFRLTCFGDNIF